MATAASFEPYYPHTVWQQTMFEGDGQTFVKGNLVFIDTGGFIVECVTDPDLIFGVAAENCNASATAETDGDKVGVYVITPGSVWSAKSDGTTAQTDLGTVLSCKLDTSVWYADKANGGSDQAVVVVGFDPRDEVGTAGGRYLVMFCFDVIQGTSTTEES